MKSLSLKSHRRIVRAGVGVVAVALSMALVGCTFENPLDLGDSAADGTVTVGSQGFPESEIVAQIYGQVLAGAGYSIDYNLAVGGRNEFQPALRDGSIDLIPDYAGELLAGANPGSTARSTNAVVASLPSALRPLGLRALNGAEAEHADALVVTSGFSASTGVVSIADLVALNGAFSIGAYKRFESSAVGRSGLDSVYGVAGWAFTPTSSDPDGTVGTGDVGTVQSLLNGVIQVAVIPATSPLILQNGLVVLEDPDSLIVAQNVVPLLDADIYTDRIADLLNTVSAKLTTASLRELNLAYAGDTKPSAALVAADWLTANELVK